MKYRIAVKLCLFTLLASMTVLPGLSYDGWFKRWDANKDGQWTWNDFRSANREWSFKFRHGKTFEDGEMMRMFHLIDRDGDGKVNWQDVKFMHKRWH